MSEELQYRQYFSEALECVYPFTGDPFDTWIDGETIRQRLNQGKWFWQTWNEFNFLQLMWEMMDEGLIQRDDRELWCNGQCLRTTCYRIHPTLKTYMGKSYGKDV